MKKLKILISIVTVFVMIFYIQSCTKEDGLVSIENNIALLPMISDYNIFQGNPSNLIPANGFKLYELATQLFTDYAEKQRLIKIPAGYLMSAVDDRLPNFPDGTILVKTFFYYNDKRDTSSGKKIIETRLLIKHDSKWNVGTYLWNNEQTEAILISTGLNKTINWIDGNGNGKVISYHIPNKRECNTCHQSGNSIIPIGPKIRNLNIDITRNSVAVNQLNYFQDSMMITPINPSSFHVLPNWQNTSNTLEERARAYLDINCAHCHNKNGFASNSNLFLSYETPFNETKIADKKDGISGNMSQGGMPKLGTTIIDEEGLALIKEYIATLP